jgi:two-component system cell cycle sensor histidine kinase/response regulator CckA
MDLLGRLDAESDLSADDFDPRSFVFPLVPENGGVVLYVREGRAPWSPRTALGDVQGVFGVGAATLRRTWMELVHHEDHPLVRDALAGIESGRSSTFDYRIVLPGGGERWLRESVRRTPAAAGGEQLVGVVRDVSLEFGLRAQVASLEERVWRAQRMDSLGEIAAGIAHDLGNLFTGVLGTVQDIDDDPALPEHLHGDLGVVRSGINRGAGFVRQILRFAARERYCPGPVDLNQVVEDLRMIVGRTLGRRIEVTVQGENDLPELHADPAQLEQVLLNLIINAKEAMPEGGHLGIRTERVQLGEPLVAEATTLLPGLYVRLTVTDTGLGIPEALRGRVFEPFFSTKVRPTSGRGFGLSTVDRIVRGLGGAITIESEEGKGTSFRIYLPVRAAAPALPEVREPVDGRLARGRLLIVEDDPAVRSVTLRILAREGFSVMAVGAAREALQVFDRVRPTFDLVVCDVALPDRSGPELVRVLRNRVPNLPVVYVSGYGREKLPNPLEPTSSFLEKPFTAEDLAGIVAEALARHASSPGVEGVKGV